MSKEVIVGIDLGTTNSLIAVCENGVPRVLKSAQGESLIPSVLYWDDKAAAPVVGAEAKRHKVTDASHTAYSVKRFMGLAGEDLAGHDTGNVGTTSTLDTSGSDSKNIRIRLGSRELSAIEISAAILRKLKNLAEENLGVSVKKAVVTVPAYFNDSQRKATQVAGTLAGLEVLRIINEPTAAALAYGFDKRRQGRIAVYDLGGGTFDFSLLHLQDGVFEVLGTKGDTHLGGDDFDHALYDIIVEKTGLKPCIDLHLKAQILEKAEAAKIALSKSESVTGSVIISQDSARTHGFEVGRPYEYTITRAEFEAASRVLVERTLKLCADALKDAGMTNADLDEVVMVGGSTRLPLVRTMAAQFFNKALNFDMNPDEAVALGAALQASILAGDNTEMVLLDVVPLSLGLETYGGTVGKLIYRNSKIPAGAEEFFTTHVEGQTKVLIHVLQGERELAQDCRSLARFELAGLPPLPAGAPKIRVRFMIDANGILKVSAREMHTGTEASVDVQPSYGLTDEQVEQMLEASLDHAESDVRSRQLIDARVEAEGVIAAARKLFATQIAASIDARPVFEQIARIEALIKSDDHVAIRDGLEKLEEVARPLSESVMNAAVQAHLTGKQM